MKPLGEITEPKIDQAGPTPNGEFTYVDISSVDNKAKRIVDAKLLPAASAPSRAKQRLRNGDVLVSMTRPNLNAVALVPPELDGAIGSTGFHVLRPRDNVLPHWLFYRVQSRQFVSAMSELVQGALYPAVRPKDIRAFRIPLPTLDEQRRTVAEIEKQFSRLDEAVANLKRVKANLKRQRSSVLQAVTSGGLAAEGRSVPRPKDWRWLTIDELASPAPRSIQSGPFGSNLRHSEFRASGKLVIGIDNVRDGDFSLGSNHRISESKFRELAKYAARPGDVLITVMATIGRVCVVPQDIEPAIITKHVYRISVNRELVIPDYVAIALRGSREVRAQLMGSVQGQTRPGLNGGLIRKIRVPIPPLDYQQSIAAEVDRRLSIVREVESDVDANLARAQALRHAVLSSSFHACSEGGA